MLLPKNVQSMRAEVRFQDCLSELDCTGDHDLVFVSETWQSDVHENFRGRRVGGRLYLSGGAACHGVGIYICFFPRSFFPPACYITLVRQEANEASRSPRREAAGRHRCSPSGCQPELMRLPAQDPRRCPRLRAGARAGSWHMPAARQQPVALPIWKQADLGSRAQTRPAWHQRGAVRGGGGMSPPRCQICHQPQGRQQLVGTCVPARARG